MQKFRNSLNASKIGFVPTMGCLHPGHLTLITKSNKKCDYTICSIFVNPQNNLDQMKILIITQEY